MISDNKISGLIITLNEEKSIHRCLSSIADICDEIVVIDSHSTDNTKQICEQFPKVNFITSEWKGYSKTKNFGHSQAQNNWILSIDADESMDKSSIEAIIDVQSRGLSGAYSFNRKNFYGDFWVRHGGWYPDRKTRLFDKRRAEWRGSHVHEALKFDASVGIIHLNGNIEHFTVRDNDHHLTTIHKYAKLAAEGHYENGKTMNPILSGISAVLRFFKIYFLKLGFLDGRVGFQVAYNSALSKWLKFTYYKALKS